MAGFESEYLRSRGPGMPYYVHHMVSCMDWVPSVLQVSKKLNAQWYLPCSKTVRLYGTTGSPALCVATAERRDLKCTGAVPYFSS